MFLTYAIAPITKLLSFFTRLIKVTTLINADALDADFAREVFDFVFVVAETHCPVGVAGFTQQFFPVAV